MAYEVTLTGAYQSAMKAATELTIALIQSGNVSHRSPEELAQLHGTLSRALFEDIKVVAQPEAEAVSPFPETATVAREAGEIAVAPGHVGHRVERGDAGE